MEQNANQLQSFVEEWCAQCPTDKLIFDLESSSLRRNARQRQLRQDNENLVFAFGDLSVDTIDEICVD